MRELGERDAGVRSIIPEFHRFVRLEVDQVFGMGKDPEDFMGCEYSVEYQRMKLLKHVIVRLTV